MYYYYYYYYYYPYLDKFHMLEADDNDASDNFLFFTRVFQNS